MEKRYEFGDFIDILSVLRSEDGCPWDREQTHSSLKKCLLEESYEVLEGIDRLEQTGNSSNLKEELGDVLLQVALHSQIAKEEELFTIDDVIQEISEKMIRRHPHVFGDDDIQQSEIVLERWEDIKKAEKEIKEEADTLRNIPKAFPPILRANKVIKKAEKLYGEKLVPEILRNDVIMEADQLQACCGMDNKEEMEQIIGEMFFMLTKLSRAYGIDPENAMEEATNRFIEQFEKP